MRTRWTCRASRKGERPGTTATVVRTVGLAALLTLAGWNALSYWPAAGRDATGSAVISPPAGPPGSAELRSLEEALSYCEQGLVRARAAAAAHPRDPRLHLRVAGMETRRCSTLALLVYERSRGPRQPDGDTEYPRWRADYLRQDPQHALTRAADAARSALHADGTGKGAPLPPGARREAYLLLAAAHKSLANPKAEAHALAAAASREPERIELWLRLADAYARARRFSRAEAAMARAMGEER